MSKEAPKARIIHNSQLKAAAGDLVPTVTWYGSTTVMRTDRAFTTLSTSRKRDAALSKDASQQKFASVHDFVCNHFWQERSLARPGTLKPIRAAVLAE